MDLNSEYCLGNHANNDPESNIEEPSDFLFSVNSVRMESSIHEWLPIRGLRKDVYSDPFLKAIPSRCGSSLKSYKILLTT